MSCRGYDYTELFPLLDIVEPQIEGWGQEEEIAAFKDGLINAPHSSVPEIKKYVLAMADVDPGYWAPLWRGLAEVEDDFTFLQACHALAEHMWT